MIIGIGFDDPFLVGLIGLGLLFVLVVIGVRVVFAAAIVGLLGLVELLGWAPAAGIVGLFLIPNPRHMHSVSCQCSFSSVSLPFTQA